MKDGTSVKWPISYRSLLLILIVVIVVVVVQEEVVYAELTLSRRAAGNRPTHMGVPATPLLLQESAVPPISDETVVYAQIDHATKRRVKRRIDVPPQPQATLPDVSQQAVRETTLM